MLWYLVKRDLPLRVFASFFCLLVASFLIGHYHIERKETPWHTGLRNQIKHIWWNPLVLNLELPLDPYPRQGAQTCSLGLLFHSCLSSCWQFVGWGVVGAYKMSSALSASKAWKTTACITLLLQAQWKCLGNSGGSEAFKGAHSSNFLHFLSWKCLPFCQPLRLPNTGKW